MGAQVISLDRVRPYWLLAASETDRAYRQKLRRVGLKLGIRDCSPEPIEDWESGEEAVEAPPPSIRANSRRLAVD